NSIREVATLHLECGLHGGKPQPVYDGVFGIALLKLIDERLRLARFAADRQGQRAARERRGITLERQRSLGEIFCFVTETKDRAAESSFSRIARGHPVSFAAPGKVNRAP